MVTLVWTGRVQTIPAFSAFDASGAIRAVFVFVRMDAHLAAVPAVTVALSQAVQMILM